LACAKSLREQKELILKNWQFNIYKIKYTAIQRTQNRIYDLFDRMSFILGKIYFIARNE
jgi:hypothetical protein